MCVRICISREITGLRLLYFGWAERVRKLAPGAAESSSSSSSFLPHTAAQARTQSLAQPYLHTSFHSSTLDEAEKENLDNIAQISALNAPGASLVSTKGGKGTGEGTAGGAAVEDEARAGADFHTANLM